MTDWGEKRLAKKRVGSDHPPPLLSISNCIIEGVWLHVPLFPAAGPDELPLSARCELYDPGPCSSAPGARLASEDRVVGDSQRGRGEGGF